MKKIFTFMIAFCISFLCYSQFYLSIDFETNGQYAVIDSLQPNNLWQKGVPNKTFFNSAYTPPDAIVTKLTGLYPANNLSTFTLKAITPNACWGIGYLTFWHKYKTDSLHAGGDIEVAYDSSTQFHNIIFDTIEPMYVQPNFFYTANDTITGNIPAFSGNSGAWDFSQFMWTWEIGTKSFFHDSLTVHFNFKSDGTAIPDEGWMIDNITFAINQCTGAVEDYDKNIARVEISPDPLREKSAFRLVNVREGNYKLSIFNRMGSDVIETTISPSHAFILSRNSLASGLYLYKVSDGARTIATGKFVVE